MFFGNSSKQKLWQKSDVLAFDNNNHSILQSSQNNPINIYNPKQNNQQKHKINGQNKCKN